MKRRLALSLLTVLALLWQGLAAAAMVPMAAAPPASVRMAEHCHMDAADAGLTASMKDCCNSSNSHCACIGACGAAATALPAGFGGFAFVTSSARRIAAPAVRITAAPPPHPFRPPISDSI